MTLTKARVAVPILMFAASVIISESAAATSCLESASARGSPRAATETHLTAKTLIGLRDIGHPDSSLLSAPSPLAIDGEGRHAAFVVSQADPSTNRYCRSLVMIPLKGANEPIILDRGGDFIGQDVERAGVVIASGTPLIVTPQWSSDGERIAYLRRDDGVTQLWLASVAERTASAATSAPRDVHDFVWLTPDIILFTTRREELPQRAEAGRGYLYDDRFVPMISARPQRQATSDIDYFELNVPSGRVSPVDRAAGASEVRTSNGKSGWNAALIPTSRSPLSPMRVAAVSPAGIRTPCPTDACQGRIIGIWPINNKGGLAFLRRTGWAGETLALHRWSVGSSHARRILETNDMLIGCVPTSADLICLRENATRTRHLVRIDLGSGSISELYDPNPHTKSWRFGPVTRIRWRNAFGLDAYGDLVLPPDIERPRNLPLIIVQYNSVGFLRGGTGDEYPIHLLAKAGFAVLSVQQPIFVAASQPDLNDAAAINAYNLKNWAERRSLLSSLETAVSKLVGMGLVDPEKIGITGLSDGATTVRFALINSNVFAAAAVSSCCMEPHNILAYTGPAYAAALRKLGYPSATAPDPDFWRPVSLALNAERIDTPLLMQLSDDEYLLSLESYVALRELGRPVELHVFPDEHHSKVQPVHRLAIYNRTIDWFSFWLNNRENPHAADDQQYRRWRAMREELNRRLDDG